jgi:NADPH:quinone reductase-like Zn-dependent oxidoreductase
VNNNPARENISLQTRGNEVGVIVEPFVADVPGDGLIIKNRFTLAGTLPDSTWLRAFPGFERLFWHPGYASVGIVEEAGRGCHYFGKGDCLFMPAVFSKFVRLDGSFINNYSQWMLIRLPERVDPVQALFLSLAGLAIYLVGELETDEVENICLLGCGLLGLIVLKIIQSKAKQAVVYIKDKEVDERLIALTGSRRIDNFKAFGDQEGGKRVMVLSDNLEYRSVLAGWSGFAVIDACKWERKTVPAKRPVRFLKDLTNEAVALIENETDFLSELIYQHVHIEFIAEIQTAIHQSQYRGRALVYDW